VNAKAHRAKRPDPRLDIHGRRILCGALGATCGQVIAWDYPAKQPDVIAIPSGLTAEGTPGRYRWSGYSLDKQADKGSPHARRDWRPPDYTAEKWREIGPIRFARVPCVIPCPSRHENDVDSAVKNGVD